MRENRKEIRKIKIGLAGLYFPNFQAAEYDIYDRSLEWMKTVAEKLGFELLAYPEMIHDEEGAEKASKLFRSEQIDFLMLQASSLILGNIVEQFADACERIGFWVVPEPTFEGEIPLNSLTGFNLGVSILRMKHPGRRVKWFYGSPDGDSAFLDRLWVTVRALRTKKNLFGSRIGLLHDVVPTFINLIYDARKLKERLGVEVVPLGLEDVFAQAGSEKIEDVESRKTVADEMIGAAADVRVPDSMVTSNAGVAASLLSIAERYRLDAAALRCWPEFQDEMHLAPCASVAYLNDNGLVTSCEGDLPGAVSMLAAWYMSGEAPTMNDPVALDMEQDLVQMWHCGPGPASWADEKGQVLDYHHTLNRRIEAGTPKSGLSSDISFKPGAVTILRVSGDGRSLFIIEGEVVDGPAPPYPGSGGWIGNMRSNDKPCTCGDLLEAMTTYGIEHHYPIMRGHHEAALREFAFLAGLEILEIPKAELYMKD